MPIGSGGSDWHSNESPANAFNNVLRDSIDPLKDLEGTTKSWFGARFVCMRQTEGEGRGWVGGWGDKKLMKNLKTFIFPLHSFYK